MRPVILSTLTTVFALAAANLTPAWADSDGEPEIDARQQRMVAITGIVTGVDSLADSSVVAFVLPSNEVSGDLAKGDFIHPAVLPDEDVVVSGSSYSIVVDPDYLPLGAVGDTGLVNFRVMVQDPGAPAYSTADVTARTVLDSSGARTWTDPLLPSSSEPSAGTPVTPNDDSKSAPRRAKLLETMRSSDKPVGKLTVHKVRPVLLKLPIPSSPGQICIRTCAPSAGAKASDRIELVPSVNQSPGFSLRQLPTASIGDDDDGDGHIGQGLIEEPEVAPASSSCPPGGAGDVVVRTSERQVTIGTAYPRGAEDTAWMTFNTGSSAEYVATLGSASYDYAVGGGWKASSSRTLEKGSGFDWDPKKYPRSFRITSTYQKVNQYYDKCQSERPYRAYWYAKTLNTGGYGENAGITRPDWANCRNIYSDGVWWRDTTGGSAYSYDAGVKAAGIIGIDLSVKRSYNQEARLAYHVHATKRICGNNSMGAPVGAAGKIMEKFHLTD